MRPIVVRLSGQDAVQKIASAMNEDDSPLVIVADDASKERAPEASRLLRRAGIVAGVLERSQDGPWAEALLACDVLFSPLAACTLAFGEWSSWPALLAVRLSQSASNRAIFSGGKISLRAMEGAGWCRHGGLTEAVSWAEGKSAEAQRLLRPILYRQAGLSVASCLALERAAFGLAWAGRDAREGARSFLEKRKPAFTP